MMQTFSSQTLISIFHTRSRQKCGNNRQGRHINIITYTFI